MSANVSRAYRDIKASLRYITVSRRCKMRCTKKTHGLLVCRQHLQIRQHGNVHFHLPKTLRVVLRMIPKTRSPRRAPVSKRSEMQRRECIEGWCNDASEPGWRVRATLFIGPPPSRLHDGIRVSGGERGGGGGYSYFGAFHN